MKAIDITGQTFNRWTVLERGPNSEKGQAQWLCKCACGTVSLLASVSIRTGHSKSCGCLKVETTVARSTKHGHSSATKLSPTYQTWVAMIGRCTRPSHRHYERYGGAGITVHPAWTTFAGFLADMGERPDGMTLDRFPDQKGNYEPGNCRWATGKQQARNKSNNRIVTALGMSMTIAEWAERIGVHPATLSTRLQEGWSEHDTITRPVHISNRNIV